MKACVLYISRTGNTKRLTEAVSESLEAPVFNVADALDHLVTQDFDLLIIGTPVMGMRPASVCQKARERKQFYSVLTP
jgi:flavodoxin